MKYNLNVKKIMESKHKRKVKKQLSNHLSSFYTILNTTLKDGSSV